MKLLALALGHRLHREQAMSLFWSDLGKEAASNNLRQILHAARRALGLDPASGSRYLASEGELLVLCPGCDLRVDVEAFEGEAENAHRTGYPTAYRAAIDLYTGDLLPEDRYEEWAEIRREELRQLYLALLLELAGLYEERGEHRPAVEVLRKAVAVEPTSEEAHVRLMRLYALSHRRGEALAQYERLRRDLARGLDLEPSTPSRYLYDEILAGRFPPTRLSANELAPPEKETSVGTDKHNLPTQRTSFVGRERAMLEVKRALPMTHLLTLIGAGGSGKTRLAVEVAKDLVGVYPDGVWLAELAPLSDETLVPQTIAEILRVPEQPGHPLRETLIEALRGKEMLLLLDNCEHLVEACARLADSLLDSCPRLKILATSREPLGIKGEVIWRVSPRPAPIVYPLKI